MNVPPQNFWKADHVMNKSDRVLILFYRLLNGERVKKVLFMNEFSLGRRSFDRYIQSVRLMLSDVYAPHELCYDAKNNEYYLTGLTQNKLHGTKILPLIFLMFEFEIFSLGDRTEILRELLSAVSLDDRRILQSTILKFNNNGNGKPDHSMFKLIWDLNLIINRQQKVILKTENNLQDIVGTPIAISYSNDQWVLKIFNELQESIICPLKNIRSFELKYD